MTETLPLMEQFLNQLTTGEPVIVKTDNQNIIQDITKIKKKKKKQTKQSKSNY